MSDNPMLDKFMAQLGLMPSPGVTNPFSQPQQQAAAAPSLGMSNQSATKPAVSNPSAGTNPLSTPGLVDYSDPQATQQNYFSTKAEYDKLFSQYQQWMQSGQKPELFEQFGRLKELAQTMTDYKNPTQGGTKKIKMPGGGEFESGPTRMR